jgi:hypothetical protein
MRHIVGSGASSIDQFLPERIISAPNGQSVLAQKIFVIEAQLLQAGPRHVGELELGFFRGAGCLASFGDVLHAGPGRLDHLVASSAARFDVPVAETHRKVENQLGHLETLELSVATMLGDQRFSFDHLIPYAANWFNET